MVRVKKKDITINDIISLFSQRLSNGFLSYDSSVTPKTNINHFSKLDHEELRSIKYGFDLVRLPPHLRNAVFYAILQETKNIFLHHVLEEVNRNEIPPDASIIPSQYVLSIKRNGSLKDRLVAAETKQFQDASVKTYAPTMNINLVYVLLAIRAFRKP